MGGNIRRKQFHIVEGGTGLGEARGGFDVVRAGVGDSLAQGDLLLIGQQAGLDNDLQELALAGLLHGGDLIAHLVKESGLGPADVDDHVHFIRAVVHSIGGHEALGGGGIVAIGEADNGTDGQSFAYILLGLPDKAGRDADGSGMVLHSVVADALDVRPGGGLGQQGMVAFGKNFRNFHGNTLLL